ncbi:MAG: DUF1573 domain-containing protein [Planctomycetes bacterium]|nr:DUF1573 domain-containing protein [Planctomycetota bacterium]
MEGKQLRFLVFVIPVVAIGGLVLGNWLARHGVTANTLVSASQAPPSAPSAPATDNKADAKPAEARKDVASTPAAPTPTATPVNPGEAPTIVFDEMEFDFGTVFAGEKVEHHYPFKNTGKGTLNVSSVKGSCGCTVAQASKNSLAPGETADVKAVFDSTGRPGQNDKTITVTSNDPKNPQVILKLHGLVREEVWADPPQVQLGQLRRGQKIPDTKIKVLTLKNQGVEIKEITASKPEIHLSQAPIETATDKGVEVTVSFPDWKAWINPNKPNYLAEWINVNTSSTKMPSKKIMVYGQILEDITCEPKFLSFPSVKKGDESDKALLISGSPQIKFHVTKVEKTFSGIETTVKTLEEGSKYELAVKVTKDAPIGRFRDTLKITTDYADQDTVTIYVYGAVKDPSDPDPPAASAPAGTPKQLKVTGFHECIKGTSTTKDVTAKYGEPTKKEPVAGTGGTTFFYVNGTHADLVNFESVEFEFESTGVLKEVRLNYKKQ